MPPKRKAATKGKGRGGKKAKVQEEAEDPTPGVSAERKAVDALKKADKGKKKVFKVDAECPYVSTGEVIACHWTTN